MYEENRFYQIKKTKQKENAPLLFNLAEIQNDPEFLEVIRKEIDTWIDNSTEKWLNEIEKSIDYMAWYCGHWHTDKTIDKMHFLYKTFEILGE